MQERTKAAQMFSGNRKGTMVNLIVKHYGDVRYDIESKKRQKQFSRTPYAHGRCGHCIAASWVTSASEGARWRTSGQRRHGTKERRQVSFEGLILCLCGATMIA